MPSPSSRDTLPRTSLASRIQLRPEERTAGSTNRETPGFLSFPLFASFQDSSPGASSWTRRPGSCRLTWATSVYHSVIQQQGSSGAAWGNRGSRHLAEKPGCFWGSHSSCVEETRQDGALCLSLGLGGRTEARAPDASTGKSAPQSRA